MNLDEKLKKEPPAIYEDGKAPAPLRKFGRLPPIMA